MLTFDAPTLLMVNAVFNCFGALVWLSLALVLRIAPRAAGAMAAAHLLLVPALLPIEVSEWSGWWSDLLKLLAMGLLTLGVRQLLRLRQTRLDIGLVGMGGIVVLLVQALADHALASLLPTAVTMTLLALLCCRDVLIGAAPGFRRLVTALMAAPFAALALVNMVRIAAALNLLPGGELMLQPRQQSALLAGLWLVLCLAMSTGLIAMVLQRLIARIEQLTRTDTLTGALNRRAFQEQLQLLQARRRRGHAYALLMIDVDHFKRINDQFGHAAGDAALQHLVAVLKGGIRDVDLLGRLGGEEFCLLLPDTRLNAATEVAERLRQRLHLAPLRWRDQQLPMTASFGLTTGQASDKDGSATLAAADAALYAAKRGGRDRVCIAEGPKP
ncbi:GGDEF domain-containing protein [Paucibacter sp. APW11]|uniref:diguanylate cyclase n=1 Tax=Roseateles aquae TaxID=3077235 RepID=A0ABU3PHB0_9BURK|nr:GGDEF domain-containing protein [Paucibacter sp. APW11]MDT9001923.1 GGDEF domain-containing protein [Paucibacter sp. APW11]